MTTVFAQGEADAVCYCTLGCVTAVNGDILVFCEARISPKDFDAHHLVYKRSRDGGRIWGPLHYLERSEAGECYMNPVPLADPKTGRLFVCYALAQRSQSTRMWIRHSDDHGETWSPRAELTNLFQADPWHREYHLPGPGHGLALPGGRLIFSVWHRRGMRWAPAPGAEDTELFAFDVPEAQRLYGAGAIISDDGGETWRAGGYLPVSSADGSPYKMSEARIAPLQDGRLFMYARGCAFEALNAPCRLQAFSDDGGETWSEPVYDGAVQPPYSCDSGLAAYADGSLLLTRPADGGMRRRRLTLYCSADLARAWREALVLDEGDAGYSDLLVLPDGGALVLYAGGYYNGFFGKELRCQAVAPEDLARAVRQARGPA